MNLYLVSQQINNDYDTYDSFVTAAESEEEARNTHPSEYVTHHRDGKWYGTYSGGSAVGQEYETENTFGSWVRRDQLDSVNVQLIGNAEDGVKGIICASFNAG